MPTLKHSLQLLARLNPREAAWRCRQGLWLTLALGLGTSLSLAAWQTAVRYEQQRDDDHFTHFSALASSNVRQRLEHAQDVLNTVAERLLRPGELSRREFHDHVQSLQVAQRFPEIAAIQWSRYVKESERAAFEAAVRADESLGAPAVGAFAIHPKGPRPAYLALEFSELPGGADAALGSDSLASPETRELTQRARDHGRALASPPLQLPPGEAGFAVHLPIYRAGLPRDSVEQRRAAYRGQLTGLWRASALLRDAADAQQARYYDLTLRDLGEFQPDRANSSAPASAPAGTPGSAQPSTLLVRLHGTAEREDGATPPRVADANLQRSHNIVVAGRLWALEVSRPARSHRLAPLPVLALAGGLFLTLLVSALLLRQTINARRARALARHLGSQVHATAQHLTAVIDSAADGILTLDMKGRLLAANRAAESLFGLDRAELVGRELCCVIPSIAASATADDPLAGLRSSDPADGFKGRRTAEAARADGTPFPIELVLAETAVGDTTQIVCTVRDLTDAKAADEAIAMTMYELNQATELQQAMLRHAAFAIVLTDAAGAVRAFNPAAERLLNCSADDVVMCCGFDKFFDPPEMEALAGAWSDSTGTAVEPGMPFLAASLGSGASVEHELHLRREDGRRVPVSLTVSAVRDEEGGIASMLLIAYDVTARRQMVAEMTQLAYTDRLTGLANRGHFERELPRALAEAQRRGVHMGLLFIDLDRFKPINDTHGHAMGDRVLCQVSQRLRLVTRGSDLVARLGGDEFVVLLPSLATPEASSVVAEKIINSLAEPMSIDGLELSVGASIGVVTYPDGGESAEALLVSADKAMYEAKQAGRNCFRLAPRSDFAPPELAPIGPARSPLDAPPQRASSEHVG